MVLLWFSKQPALLTGAFVNRRHVFAITNAKTVEVGEKVLARIGA
jgi:hypothetical protein